MHKGIAEALKEFDMEIKECLPLDKSKNAELSAGLVNEFTKKSFEVLDAHSINKDRERKRLLKANIILSRDPGNYVPKLWNISKKYGKKWAIFADMPLEIGIGRLAGMDVISLPTPTFTKKDYDVRLEKVFSNIKKYDCLYIHIKGPDLFAHDGDFEGKKKSLEDIDKYFFEPLLKKINLKENLIVVTGDHATPCIDKAHSADPVPILIAGNSVKSGNVEDFNEDACKSGSLGIIKGIDLMDKIMQML